MSYTTISVSSNDQALVARVTAAAAEEAFRNPAFVDTDYAAQVRNSPQAFVTPLLWAVITAADVEAAYASALAAGNPNPGGDDAVVTDGMILANVQASWPPDPP
jgi:hypothetical protein